MTRLQVRVVAWGLLVLLLVAGVAMSLATSAYYGWPGSPKAGHCYRYEDGPWWLRGSAPHAVEMPCQRLAP